MKPLDMVIFGGTGDLAQRKLLPALFLLLKDHHIPAGSRIMAVAHSQMDPTAFQDLTYTNIQHNVPAKFYEEADWEKFSRMLSYLPLDLSAVMAGEALATTLQPDENRQAIYYMSLPPHLFAPTCHLLKHHGLNHAQSRLVIEKPLGEDAASAAALHNILIDSFNESQIYRIDHYLGKEAVQNLLALKFGNRLIQAIWNRDNIDYMEITVAEELGLEGRAGFLDRAGIVRDMVQSHLLQILCCLAMETPLSLDADDIRDEKLRIMKSLVPITAENIHQHVVRGQYTCGVINGRNVPGYSDDIAQSRKGRTDIVGGKGETYVALKVLIDNDRWQGVPFYLRTGKRLTKRYAEIVVHLKPSLRNLYKVKQENKLIIELQPDMRISFDMFMKQLVSDDQEVIAHRQSTDLTVSTPHKTQIDRIPDAYEKLLLKVIQGDQTYFLRHDEIMASWKWIDKLRAAWKDVNLPMEFYPAGSMGPAAASALLRANGHSWHNEQE